MKHFLTFLSVVLLPLACVGAPSYTTYFNNTHTYTNASVAGTARVNSLVVTNGISSAANWTASGATNSTLPGVASANRFVATNGVHSVGNGTGGSFVGNPTDSATWWGSSDFSGISYIDFPQSSSSPQRDFYLGAYMSSSPSTYSYSNIRGGTNSAFLSATRIVSGSGTGIARIGVDSDSGYLLFGASIVDTYLRRDAANTLAMRNGTTAQRLNEYGTFTDASNYRRGYITTSTSGVFGIGSEGLGTGATGNSIQFLTDGTARWNISSSGHILAGADNTYDIGASGATRPRHIYAAGAIVAGTGGVSPGGAANIAIFSTSSSLLQIGGTSSSFPALKRSGTELQVRLADDSADGPLKSGQLSNTGIRVMTPSSLQTLAAGNALLANATKVRVVGSGGAVTLTSTPTIADGSDGQYVMIQGTDNTNTLTVQDQGSLASSNLELGAATRVLGSGDVLVLTFDTTASVWYEVSFANN